MESSVNKPSDVIENIDLSISVQNVINRRSKKGKVNAKEIIDELLSDHTGYARGKFPPITISSGYNKTVEDWIKEVHSLYDQEKMRSLYIQEKVALLTGRHVILGLCAIERDLGKQLQKDDFLEGIQTLFRETEVTYVVAADKRWLCTSYEKVYNDFIETVNEPGRPLGHLFIEKTFQFTVSLPRLSPKRKKDYWQHLMSINKSGRQKDQDKARIDAQQRMKELRTEKEITEELKMSSHDPVYDQAIREAAIVRLAEPDVGENTEEHILKQFADLMEPNPRAMKRFANSYGVQMAMDIMRGGSMETEKLALWTIILLRWPLLAEFLGEHPEMVEFIGKESIPEDSIPQNLHKLFQDSNIIDVIKGKGVGVMMDEDTIRNLNDLPVKNRIIK
jgi:hypothetical protein